MSFACKADVGETLGSPRAEEAPSLRPPCAALLTMLQRFMNNPRQGVSSLESVRDRFCCTQNQQLSEILRFVSY